jgi:hypothetical protein
MWLLLLVAMFANGMLRVFVLQPRLGEHAARQVAVFLGIVIIFGLALPFVKSLPRPTPAELLRVGLLWLALTVAFEFLFGHYVSGASWDTLLADYDLLRGRLWPLVLLSTAVAPWVWGKVLKDR